ncbi:MAG TPA: hypothetical protein VG960_10100 [Caulobacteraceae bacterium]|nr:hypothetical protein [Caulobacteraceae bacterium]
MISDKRDAGASTTGALETVCASGAPGQTAIHKTESPPIFHAWTAIACTFAVFGADSPGPMATDQREVLIKIPSNTRRVHKLYFTENNTTPIPVFGIAHILRSSPDINAAFRLIFV